MWQKSTQQHISKHSDPRESSTVDFAGSARIQFSGFDFVRGKKIYPTPLSHIALL